MSKASKQSPAPGAAAEPTNVFEQQLRVFERTLQRLELELRGRYSIPPNGARAEPQPTGPLARASDLQTLAELVRLIAATAADHMRASNRALRALSSGRGALDWQRAALGLRDLLDEIDTADDFCRDNHHAFRKYARQCVERANETLVSLDGQTWELLPAREPAVAPCLACGHAHAGAECDRCACAPYVGPGFKVDP